MAKLIRQSLGSEIDGVSELYAKAYKSKSKKLKGQFFTPKRVGEFMASMFDIDQDTIRLLDPGAGTGILSAAFCKCLLSGGRRVSLTIDAYENDPDVLPVLKMVLESCKANLEEAGHRAEYNIYDWDFILHNEAYFKKYSLIKESDGGVLYDFVISNPPYYKLNKGSPQSKVMNELVSGQPNIYALFMALSANMLKPGGEMVFITPRSFCSGLYYKRFREWLLSNVRITDIHIFESRKEVFDADEVLQENVILKARKTETSQEKLTVSISKNKKFDDLRRIEVRYDDVVSCKNGEIFLRIPTSSCDVDILRTVDIWPNTFSSLGLEISTGPVVPFRTEQYLLPRLIGDAESAPLLWMHNMQGLETLWPLPKNKKPPAIRVCDETLPLLLPVKNYVLVKRFSSKEQRRRLYAAVLLASEFLHEIVGIENHVNYIHRPKGNLSVYEAFGIAALLNTAFMDNYFRSLSGSTQVNAADMRNLPLPHIEDIRKIGEITYGSRYDRNGFDLEGAVAGILGISAEMIKTLNTVENRVEQS